MKYAEIIVLLAQQGIPIVISTHSPYIINGIETYSNKYKIKESKVKFYFAERKESNLIDFVDKSNDVQPIYDALAKPLQKLAFQ